MRSRKAELSEVEKQFESWRSKPHGRLIPEELWNAAVGLLDRYTPSAICRHLRLNSARFKKVRKTHGAVVSAKRLKGGQRRVSGVGSLSKKPGRSGTEQVSAIAPSRTAFVELAHGMGLSGGMMTPPLNSVQGEGTMCRLTVESASRSLTVVTSNREGENELVESVCRFVVGALGNGTHT